MYKLDRPLYHGTSAAAAIFILCYGFKAPVHLTEDEQSAIHYAKAATAYVEHEAKEDNHKLIRDGWAVFTFYSVPNKMHLVPDDYNPQAEPGQWRYENPIRGLKHFTIQYGELNVTEEENLYLRCFAIGMWRD